MHASWFIYYYLIVSMKSYWKGCVHSLHSRCFIISCMQEHGIHGNNWVVPLLPSPHTKTPSRYGHFSLISRRLLSNTWGSIKLNGSLLNRTLLSFLEKSSEFMVFKVKLWSLPESLKMLFNSAVFLSSCE